MGARTQDRAEQVREALANEELARASGQLNNQKLGNHGNLPGPGPGRPKGVPNKVNRDLKEAYLMAANLAGGKEGLIGYLKKQAELENPSAFMTGLSKLLPSMLEGNPDAPLIVERVYYTRDGGLKPMCLACSSISHVVQ